MNATKERFGAADLPALFDGAKRIVVARGKKIMTFDPAQDDEAEIARVVLGPSGNLRAPTLRRGKNWLVGFHAEAYAQEFD